VLNIVIFLLVLASSLWVLADASNLGAKRGALGGGFLDSGAGAWFFGCLLFWIIAFPCYLVARPRLVAAKRARESSWRAPYPLAPANYGQPWPQPYPGGAGPSGFAYPAPQRHRANPPRAHRTRYVALLIAAALALAGAGFAGWRLLAAHGTSAPASTHPIAGAGPSPVPAQSDPGAILETIALHTNDFRAGYTMQLMTAGAQVAGQVTLDNCGYRFSTESHRVARRQYLLYDAGEPRGLSNELVAYDTRAQAQLALAQWHDAAAHCPRTAVRSSVAGMPKLTERITRNQLHVAGLPDKCNALTVESATAAGQGTLYSITILQVHGRILDAVYLNDARAPTSQEIDGAIRIAAITGERLVVTS
jgi:hypothetical protein